MTPSAGTLDGTNQYFHVFTESEYTTNDCGTESNWDNAGCYLNPAIVAFDSFVVIHWTFTLDTSVHRGIFTIHPQSRSYLGNNYVTHHIRDELGNIVAAKAWLFTVSDPCLNLTGLCTITKSEIISKTLLTLSRAHKVTYTC